MSDLGWKGLREFRSSNRKISKFQTVSCARLGKLTISHFPTVRTDNHAQVSRRIAILRQVSLLAGLPETLFELLRHLTNQYSHTMSVFSVVKKDTRVL
jgi:hypothetical protein